MDAAKWMRRVTSQLLDGHPSSEPADKYLFSVAYPLMAIRQRTTAGSVVVWWERRRYPGALPGGCADMADVDQGVTWRNLALIAAVETLPQGPPLGVCIGPVELACGDLSGIEAVSVARAAPKRQAEFLAGRACAHAALASIGELCRSVPIGRDRAPVWPAGVVGSISHGAGLAGAIVGRTSCWQALGLDIEGAGPLPPGLGARVAREDELALCRTVGIACDEAKLLFSIKEAVFKASWPLEGAFLNFADVGLTRLDASSRRFAAVVSRHGARGKWEGVFACVDGVVVAIAARGVLY